MGPGFMGPGFMGPGFMRSGFMGTRFMGTGVLGTGFLAPVVGTRRGPSTPVLPGCGSRRGVAAAGRATVFPRQRNTDQLFDVAQITHFLAARDQRDRNAFTAGARGPPVATDLGFL